MSARLHQSRTWFTVSYFSLSKRQNLYHRIGDCPCLTCLPPLSDCLLRPSGLCASSPWPACLFLWPVCFLHLVYLLHSSGLCASPFWPARLLLLLDYLFWPTCLFSLPLLHLFSSLLLFLPFLRDPVVPLFPWLCLCFSLFLERTSLMGPWTSPLQPRALLACLFLWEPVFSTDPLACTHDPHALFLRHLLHCALTIQVCSGLYMRFYLFLHSEE